MENTVERLKHDFPGLKGGWYKPFSDSDLKTIADAAFEVLEKSGMKVYTQQGFNALKQAGADVDAENQIVRMSRSFVEDAIDSNPSSITLYSRDGEFDAVLEGSRVHYGTGGTALYVLDPDTGERREAEVKDVILNARMVDALKNIHVFTINVFPNEIKDKEHIDTNRFFHALDNTTKHVMGGIYSMDGCKKAVQIAEKIAGGEQALRDKPFVSFITLVISPFKIDKHYGDMTCYLAQKGLPVVVPTEPICGTTSPITLASNVLTHIAETIGGVAMVQAVNKGAPAICGSVGSITDLRTMGHLAGPIERGMINAGVSQLAQHFKIPYYSTGGTSDAKEMDIQAAYESAMSAMLVSMSGANYIHDIAGLMEFDLTVSYDKLVVDNEILGMCQRVLRGIEVNEDTLATELMIKKGPAGDYLGEEHTLGYMREEFCVPKISNREHREQESSRDSAMVRARSKVDVIRKAPAKSCLDENIRQEILDNFAEIKRLK